jgi:hypothetical protein
MNLRKLNEVMGKLEADARALWAVRVLDRWAERNAERALSPEQADPVTSDVWAVFESGEIIATGATPDAARIAAAEALVAEDPTLGEGL